MTSEFEHESTDSVELPSEIVERVEDRLPRTEWEQPGEYITFVLEEVLYHVEEETESAEPDTVDEEEVKNRLKSLGYLDE